MTDPNFDGRVQKPHPVETNNAPDDEIDLSKVIMILRRRWKILLLGALVGLALGIAYAATTTKLYKAAVQLSLDAREATNARELTGLQTLGMSETEITTEIEVIKSQAVARKVVDRLSLADNPTFMQPPKTVISRLRGLVDGAASQMLDILRPTLKDIPDLPTAQADERLNAELSAVNKLRANMSVTRLRDSRVVEISFASSSAALSAKISNTIAEVYIDDELESKFDATQRVTDWLKERSDQLRQESVQLDNAVERFKRQNGLVGLESGDALSAQFDQLTQQLSAATAQLVDQQARQRFLQDIIETGDTSAAVSSTSEQSITSDLRSRYLDVLKDYNSLKSRLGEDHEQTIRRKAELDQLQDLLFEEIKRSEEVVRNEIVVTERRIAQLEDSLLEAEAELGTSRDLLVELREMEQEANSVRSLYTSFLQKYQQSSQEQSFTVSNVRILNPAKIPKAPSFPNTSRVTLLSIVLGVMAATAWVAISEFRDKTVRTGEQIQNNLGLEFLGGLREVTGLRKVSRPPQRATGSPAPDEVSFPELLRYAVDKPLTGFAETFRAVKMAITLRSEPSDCDAKGRVVGVFSAFPSEGKTTTSSNLANLLSSQGHNVILIDTDLRNPGLTRACGADVHCGLVDILRDGVDWRQVVCRDPETGLQVILNKRERVVHTSDLVGGDAMFALLEKLKAQYDFIILDMPPLEPVVDARATLPFLDGFVLVVSWGRTNISQVDRLLFSDPRLREKCLGAVLNFFDERRARAYGHYSGDYYYRYAYKRYYNDH